MQIQSLMLTAALSLCAICNDVLAAGAHADGHEHGDDAVGVPGDAARVVRTIAVNMTDDMRFAPARITVRQGETVRFKVTNSGRLRHELVLGTDKALKEHNEAMKKYPGMEHDEPNMVTLAPAKTGEIVWQFTKSGKVDFACLQPGHFEAGMKGQVMVAAKKTQKKGSGRADRKH